MRVRVRERERARVCLPHSQVQLNAMHTHRADTRRKSKSDSLKKKFTCVVCRHVLAVDLQAIGYECHR